MDVGKIIEYIQTVQDLDKYRVPPPDSQPEDVHDPAWFESPLKHYVPSWILSQRYQETAAGGTDTGHGYWDSSNQTWETAETYDKTDKSWDNTADEKPDWTRTWDSYDQTWETAETYGTIDKAWETTAADSR